MNEKIIITDTGYKLVDELIAVASSLNINIRPFIILTINEQDFKNQVLIYFNETMGQTAAQDFKKQSLIEGIDLEISKDVRPGSIEIKTKHF